MEASSKEVAVSRPKQWWLSTQEFFRDTAGEMRKVTWPNRNEVVGTTMVVIAATLVFAVYLWGCDEIFGRGVLWLLRTFGANV
jgi:preprotein translocase subunit SecE